MLTVFPKCVCVCCFTQVCSWCCRTRTASSRDLSETDENWSRPTPRSSSRWKVDCMSWKLLTRYSIVASQLLFSVSTHWGRQHRQNTSKCKVTLQNAAPTLWNRLPDRLFIICFQHLSHHHHQHLCIFLPPPPTPLSFCILFAKCNEYVGCLHGVVPCYVSGHWHERFLIPKYCSPYPNSRMDTENEMPFLTHLVARCKD